MTVTRSEIRQIYAFIEGRIEGVAGFRYRHASGGVVVVGVPSAPSVA